MKPEKQRIAIAEACGWSDVNWNGVYSDLMGKKPGSDRNTFGIPNYLNDLNAMHEARKILTAAQKGEYARILKALTWQSDQPEFCAMDATAAQEAEALLRTLNLWQE